VWRFLRNRRLILRLHRPTIFRALTYWAHRAVILAIAWFPCYFRVLPRSNTTRFGRIQGATRRNFTIFVTL